MCEENNSNKQQNPEVNIDTIYHFSIETERDSIKTALIINSGSAIALMAFAGALVNCRYSYIISQLSWVILINVLGVWFAGRAYIYSHTVHIMKFNQTRYIGTQKARNRKIEDIVEDIEVSTRKNKLSTGVVKIDKYRGISYFCFLLGCIVAFCIFALNF